MTIEANAGDLGAPTTERAPAALPVETTAARDNGFGFLRLLFASLVIVSHSFEMLYRSEAHEPLYRLSGAMTFGALAVDGFFLISGYLIAASFAASPGSYFFKRILRIYPGFIACYLLCVLVVAPIGQADLAQLSGGDWFRLGYRMLLLKGPEIEGAFPGLGLTALNGSMWTISYEFRCYIMAAVFGVLGLYKRPRLFVGLTAIVVAFDLALTLGLTLPAPPGGAEALLGEPGSMVHLLAVFMCGTSFWLLRLNYSARIAAVAAVGLVISLFFRESAQLGAMTLGGYALFWAAFRARWRPFRTINAKDDISYGVYLYAWPIALVAIWFWRDISPVALGLLTLAGSIALGAVSWRLIEKPALGLKGLIPGEKAKAARRPSAA